MHFIYCHSHTVDSQPVIIHTDPAIAFKALTDDPQSLKQHGIILETGDAKNRKQEPSC